MEPDTRPTASRRAIGAAIVRQVGHCLGATGQVVGRAMAHRSYLGTIVTRLCIDELRSARVRREQYVGEWLPEPRLDHARTDPADSAEVADSLTLAFLVLPESLTPEQRGAFLLRDVFDLEEVSP